ncbi:MAG: hypothetical protein IJG94_00715 [Clostridia bacterium]|nr:hypothetical protein [Clostridia bacterium]
MKKWLAWILIPVLAFCFLPGGAAAEEENADIQETVVTREDQGEASTASDDLMLLVTTLRSDEFKDLIRNPEVKDVISEVVTNLSVYLIENRPVTMKILEAWGLKEHELNAVGALWDSADRLYHLEQEYEQTEDGEILFVELKTLIHNPVFIQFCDDYRRMLESSDLQVLLEGIRKAAQKGKMTDSGEVAERFREKGISEDSISADLMKAILSVAELETDTRESLKLLLKEPDFWKVVNHVTGNQLKMDMAPITEELNKLLENEDVMRFLQENGRKAIAFLNFMQDDLKKDEDTQSAVAGSDEGAEEVVADVGSDEGTQEAAGNKAGEEAREGE